jgi:hypothetical protein
MRIAFLKSYLLWAHATGGELTHLAWLRALSEAGHEVTMRYAVDPMLPEGAMESLISVIRHYDLPLVSADSHRVVYLAQGVRVETIREERPPSSWILSWLDDLQPDVVMGDLKDTALAPLLPVIWRDRGFLFVQDVATVETLARVLTAEARARLRNSSFTIVATSHFLRARVSDRLDLCAKVAYPLVDRGSTSTAADINAPITMFGTTREKGFDLFEKIARSMPSRVFRAVANWNESERTATLENLRFAQFVLDPTELYDSSSIVLVPSRVPEGFGRVALEAMAAGRPVVVTDRGALPEVVGDVGIVIPSEGEITACDRWVDAVYALREGGVLREKRSAGVSRAGELRKQSLRQLEQLLGFTRHI